MRINNNANTASIRTPFMNTTDKCLKLFRNFEGYETGTALVNISVISEELITNLVQSVQGTAENYWIGVYLRLPQGIHSVLITGSSIDSRWSVGVLLDDLEIVSCTSFEGTDFLFCTFAALPL